MVEYLRVFRHAGFFVFCQTWSTLTLKQVAAVVGVTKERVRQIQSRAMGKLTEAAEKGQVEYSA